MADGYPYIQRLFERHLSRGQRPHQRLRHHRNKKLFRYDLHFFAAR